MVRGENIIEAANGNQVPSGHWFIGCDIQGFHAEVRESDSFIRVARFPFRKSDFLNKCYIKISFTENVVFESHFPVFFSR